MNIDGCIIAHHRFDGAEIFIHPVEILLLLPHVAVHLLLKGGEAVVIDLFALFDLARLALKVITPEIDFLRVVRTGRKRRINVNKINLDTLILQVGACAQTFAADHEIVGLGIRADLLLQLHLIARHAATKTVLDLVIAVIAQRPCEIENRLSLDRIGCKRYEFSAHHLLLEELVDLIHQQSLPLTALIFLQIEVIVFRESIAALVLRKEGRLHKRLA